MNHSSFLLTPSSALLARRRTVGAAVLSASAVALLGGRDALAAGAKTDARQHEADVRILNTALAAEYEAVAAYQVGAESGLLTSGVLPLAQQFQGHHKEHADAIAGAVQKMGGKPVQAKAQYGLPTDKLKAEADVLRFAAGLERGACRPTWARCRCLPTVPWRRWPPASWATRPCTGPCCARPWVRRRCPRRSCHDPSPGGWA